jgi:hypothetical protein
MDLFIFSNFSLGGMAIVTDLYSTLEGYREWESDREIQREDQKKGGDYASMIREMSQ